MQSINTQSLSTGTLRGAGILLIAMSLVALIPCTGWAQGQQLGRKHAPPVRRGDHSKQEEAVASPEDKDKDSQTEGAFSRPQDGRSCMAAYKGALEKERTGRLREARDLLFSCANSICGSFLLQECTTRHTRLDSDIPSVVLSVSDESGLPRGDAQVKIDGRMLASPVDGRALLLDPGIHEFSFVADGEVFSTKKVMVLQGQRNRPVTASLSAPNAAKHVAELEVSSEPVTRALASETSVDLAITAKRPAAARGPLPYLLTGAGLAGLGGAALLYYWAHKDQSKASACLPGCSQATEDRIGRLKLGADLSVGIGAAVFLAGAWLFFRNAPATEGDEHPRPNYQLDVASIPSGAVATVSGAF